MIEIVHTSSSKGLLVPNAGYGIVACTGTAPTGLEEALAEGSTASVRSPITHDLVESRAIYRIWPLRTRNAAVLVVSRIVPVIADFSGRQARLAHHVALEPRESTAEQVCSLLLSTDFFLDTWTGDPRWLPVRDLPTVSAERLTEAARAFEAITLNPREWCKFLATMSQRPTNNPQAVLVPPASETRLLLAAIVADATAVAQLRLETSADHLMTARPSVLIINPCSADPAGLALTADWATRQGAASPPATPVRKAASTIAIRDSPLTSPPDLANLPQPLGPSDPGHRWHESNWQTFESSEPSASTTNCSGPSGALIALLAYVLGVTIGAGTTLALGLALGAFASPE
jgi:hypothetical protein